MTDDRERNTVDDEQAESGKRVSLPIIDVFASLEAQLREKERRIEELQTGGAAPAGEPDSEARFSQDRSQNPSPSGTKPTGSRASGFNPVRTVSNNSSSHDSEDEGGEADAAAVSEEGDPETERSTIEATGGWPEPDDIHRDPDPELQPAPEAGAENPEELAQRLSEEFGIAMETDPDLTGGSLSSATNDESSSTTASESSAPDSESSMESSEGSSRTAAESEGAESDDVGKNAQPVDSRADDQPLVDADGSADESGVDAAAGSTDATDSADAVPSVGPPGGSGATDSDDSSDAGVVDPTADRGARLTELVEWAELRDEDAVVSAFIDGIQALDDVTRGMFAHYRQAGATSPVDAHVAAGGSGKRQYAYARNRTLRKAGLIEHVGSGRYRSRLPELVAEVIDTSVDEETLQDTVASIVAATGIAER